MCTLWGCCGRECIRGTFFFFFTLEPASEPLQVEDCAHSLGVLWKGVHSGHHGDMACISSQSYKMLNSGEGGTPYTLHPTPYTLQPYTLHPTTLARAVRTPL